MRKSVERREQQARSTVQKRGFFWRHLLIFIMIPVLLLLDAGLLWYMHTKEASDSKAQAQAHAERIAAIDKDVKAKLQKKIDDAKKAEAEAKAKAEADEAARKAAAAAKPAGIVAANPTCDVVNPASTTVVVNKKHCFNPITWAPGDLASVNGFLLRAETANQMTAMMGAAAAAGVGFDLSSAYRSYANQATTYNNWVAVNGSQAAADTVSARPGYSEHQTGLAGDLKVGSCVLECFAGTAQYTWLTQHAAEYGFIQRYPAGLTSITGYAAEAWHWRYVGVATALDMKTKGIQTLEQYFGVSGGDYA